MKFTCRIEGVILGEDTLAFLPSHHRFIETEPGEVLTAEIDFTHGETVDFEVHDFKDREGRPYRLRVERTDAAGGEGNVIESWEHRDGKNLSGEYDQPQAIYLRVIASVDDGTEMAGAANSLAGACTIHVRPKGRPA